MSQSSMMSQIFYPCLKTYQKYQQKRRLTHLLQDQGSASATRASAYEEQPSYDIVPNRVMKAFEKLEVRLMRHLFGNTYASANLASQPRLRHHQTARDIQNQKGQSEQAVDEALIISVTSLGIAVAGTLIYWPLSLLSLPGLIYGSIPMYQNLYNGLFGEQPTTEAPDDDQSASQGWGVDFLAAFMQTIIIAGGYTVLGSLATTSFYVREKLLFVVQDQMKNSWGDMVDLTPRVVWRLVDGVEIETDFETLELGDIVVIRAGETVPIDGTIVGGKAMVDQRLLTAETQPVEKTRGAVIWATTVVISGTLWVTVEKMGQSTTLAQIRRMLDQTAHFKFSRLVQIETLSEQLALSAFVAGALSWPLLGTIRAAAVVDSHPEQQMSVTGSLSWLNLLNLASQRRILIKAGRSLERLQEVDTIVFDLKVAHAQIGSDQTVANDMVTEVHQIIQVLRLYPQLQSFILISSAPEATLKNSTTTLGIDRYVANVLPANKAALIAQMQRSGRSVCFISDDVNNDLALNQADVSIALQGDSIVATNAAHIVMMDGSLEQLPQLFDLRQTFDTNVRDTLLAVLLPTAISVGGVIFFNFGLFHVAFWSYLGFYTSLGLAMAPWYKHQGQIEQFAASVTRLNTDH